MRRKGLKVLLLRRHFTELEKTHILEVPKEMPADVATYNATAKVDGRSSESRALRRFYRSRAGALTRSPMSWSTWRRPAEVREVAIASWSSVL